MYGPAWHCIVGSGFGSFVTHSTGCFLYFSMEKLCILLFRTKIQKAGVWVLCLSLLVDWDSHYSLLKVCIISHYGMKHINLDLIGYWTPLWSAFRLLNWAFFSSFWAYYSRKLRWSHIYDNHVLLSTNLIFLVNVKNIFTHVPINVKTVKGSWKMKMTCSLSWFLMWYQDI